MAVPDCGSDRSDAATCVTLQKTVSYVEKGMFHKENPGFRQSTQSTGLALFSNIADLLRGEI